MKKGHFWLVASCRDSVDSKRTCNNGSDWVRGAVPGVVYSSAWMDCGNSHSLNIFLHHSLYLQSLSRLLQVSRHWQEKLYLHGCSQSQFRCSFFFFLFFLCTYLLNSNFNLLKMFLHGSGGRMNIGCGLAQQANLNGLVVGYTITAALSMV